MSQKNEKIFNKIKLKDYTSELEKILEYKKYSETSKNYLLSMMYKIENSYKDYATVKRFVPKKDKFIKEILYIIENKCNKINILKLKELVNIKKDELIEIDDEKGIIRVIPNEQELLKALTKLDYIKNKFPEKDILIYKPINQLLNMGKSQNIVEEIKDFDGWAWNSDVTNEDKTEILSNIIYNNLIMIYGRELIENWLYTEMSYGNYIKKLRNLLDRENSKEEVKNIFDTFEVLSTLIFLTKDNKKEYIKRFKEQEKNMIKLNDKKSYISSITEKRDAIIKKVKNIDKILKNRELINSEFLKNNKKLPEEKKIYSVKEYVSQLGVKRKNYLEKVRKYNEMIHEQNLIEMKQETKAEYDYLKNLKLNENTDKILEDTFIKFQKMFLDLISARLENINDSDNLVNLIYLFRYYEFMPVDKERKIKDISKLKKQIEDIEKIIILKAINIKVIVGIGNLVDINLQIYKKVLFNTKIINLENIVIEAIKFENKIRINIYDGTIFEDSLIVNIAEPKKVGIRIKKKIEVFI